MLKYCDPAKRPQLLPCPLTRPSLAHCQITTPCADHACNSVIKFGALRQACLERYGAQYLATGHYAQVVPNAAPGTPPTLRRGLDGNKDQSYFLCTVPADNFHNVGQWSEATLNAHQLTRQPPAPPTPQILMPLGTLTKPQVRKMAKDAGLPSAERKDSYGVCFIGKRKLASMCTYFHPRLPPPPATTASHYSSCGWGSLFAKVH